MFQSQCNEKGITLVLDEPEKIPSIIAMSDNAYPQDIQKSIDAGMNAHLAKPVNPHMMYETIQKFVNN